MPVNAAAPTPLPTGYLLHHVAPTSEEYVHLRQGSGLSPRTPEQAAGALENSWAWTVVRAGDGTLAAMGRIIGDGTWYFHLADIATAPDQQRLGLGRAVMEDLISRIDAAAPAHPYITLLADPPGQRLYRGMGFVDSAPSVGGDAIAPLSLGRGPRWAGAEDSLAEPDRPPGPLS